MSLEFAVHHILSASSSIISEVLERQLAIAPDKCAELLRLGAIWCNHVRTRENNCIEKGVYLRVHADPRRYPTHKILWKDIIVFENEDFVIVNKPSGIPMHATVDNFVENVIFNTQTELKCEIHITQRLDTPTEGLVLLAKTKIFQSQFNKLLRDRSVHKSYMARAEKSLPTGVLTHYMQQTLHAPKVVVREPTPTWQECRLIIKSVTQQKDDFDLDIELLTGRTHQIRVQLADMGAPILGDKLYGSQRQNPWVPTSYIPPESIALKAYRLEFQSPNSENKFAFESK